MITPRVPSMDKIIGFTTAKLDRKKREYVYDIEKMAN